MLRRLLTVVALVLLPVTAFAVLPRDFPLSLKHSVIAKKAQDLQVAPGPFCDPEKAEILAKYEEGGYNWRFLATVDDTGAGQFIFIQFAHIGDSGPLAVYVGHSDAADTDTIVIDRAIDGAQVNDLYPGGPCTLLYPKTA